MWKEFPPCRGDPCCPLACTRWNYTVFLMFSLTQGGEKLPFYSKRILPLETAKRILEREVSQAKQEGAPAMTVILRGGDPLDRSDDLLDLAEYAGVLGGRARIGVQVMFTTDPGRLLAFRKEYSSRYDGAAPVLLARINCHGLDPDVKRLAPECLVDYGITAENVHTFYDDAVWLAEHAGRLRLEWNGGADAQAKKQYFDQLKSLYADSRIDSARKKWLTDGLELELMTRHKLETQSPFPSGGKCYDTTGWAWPCPELSPLRLLSREMNDRVLLRICQEESPLPELVWTCPGRLMSKGGSSAYKEEAAAERMELAYCQGALLQSQLSRFEQEPPERRAFEREVVRVLAHMILDAQKKTADSLKS